MNMHPPVSVFMSALLLRLSSVLSSFRRFFQLWPTLYFLLHFAIQSRHSSMKNAHKFWEKNISTWCGLQSPTHKRSGCASIEKLFSAITGLAKDFIMAKNTSDDWIIKLHKALRSRLKRLKNCLLERPLDNSGLQLRLLWKTSLKGP